MAQKDIRKAEHNEGKDPEREGLLGRMAEHFARLSLKYMPDAFVLASILTALVFLTALISTGMNPNEGFTYWGEGWMAPDVLVFMAQIVISVISGYAVVTAPPSRRLLLRVASLPRTPRQAIVVVTIAAMALSYIHWVFGIVMSGLFAKEVAKRVPGVHYPLLIASAFSGYIVWHAGISGIVPQSVAAQGHPLEHLFGVIPVSQTLFHPVNLCILGVLVVTVPLLNASVHPRPSRTIEISSGAWGDDPEPEQDSPVSDPPSNTETVAARLERSRVVVLVLAILGAGFLANYFIENGPSLNINILNMMFITISLVLFLRPMGFSNSVFKGNAMIVGPILLMFPLYGGIAGIIDRSGLGEQIVNLLADHASADTLPVVTFLVAGVMNLFVPSGGGLWLLEGPLIGASAVALGSDPSLNVIAFAWGDNWTNMMQPFWALPLLALAGLRARHIVGYTLLVGIWEGVVVVLGLLFLPHLF